MSWVDDKLGLNAGFWYAGEAPPAEGIGKNLDFYVIVGDVDGSGTVYHKTNGAWDEIGSLSGGGGGGPPVVGIWYSGTAVPAVDIGNDGDFYLQTGDTSLDGTVYQKQIGAWVEVGSIIPEPPPPVVGVWHSNNAPPDVDLGNEGDFFLETGDTSNDGRVSQKQAGAWVEVGSIVPPPPVVSVADLNLYSPVDVFIINTTLNNGTGETVGSQFFIRPGATAVLITGIRFYWNSALGETVKVSLYDPAGGAPLRTVNVVTSGIGKYTGTFATPYSVSGSAYQKLFTAAFFQVSAGKYSHAAGNASPLSTYTPARPFFGGRRLGWVGFNRFGSGDSNPTLDGSTEWVPVEPVLSEV